MDTAVESPLSLIATLTVLGVFMLGMFTGAVLAFQVMVTELRVRRARLRHLQQTRGTVVRVIRGPMSKRSKTSTYQREIGYQTLSGEIRTSIPRVSVSSATPPFQVGDTLTIFYDPEQIVEPVLIDRINLFARPIIFGILGTGAAGVVAWLLGIIIRDLWG